MSKWQVVTTTDEAVREGVKCEGKHGVRVRVK